MSDDDFQNMINAFDNEINQRKTFKIISDSGEISVKLNRKTNTLKIKNTDLNYWDTTPVSIVSNDSNTKKTSVKKMVKEIETAKKKYEDNKSFDSDMAKNNIFATLITVDGENYKVVLDKVELTKRNNLRITLSVNDFDRVTITPPSLREIYIELSNSKTLREKSLHLVDFFTDGIYKVVIEKYINDALTQNFIGSAIVGSRRNKTNNVISKNIKVDYIFGNNIEEDLKHFDQSSHEHFIEQIQNNKNKRSFTSEIDVLGDNAAWSETTLEKGIWRYDGDNEKIYMTSTSSKDIYENTSKMSSYQKYYNNYVEIKKKLNKCHVIHHAKNSTTGRIEILQVATYENINIPQGANQGVTDQQEQQAPRPPATEPPDYHHHVSYSGPWMCG